MKSDIECHLHETPFGSIPTFYFIFNTDPVNPFLWEQCLYYRGEIKEKDPFVSALSLMRLLKLQKHLYVVPFDKITGEVIINKTQIINEVFRERLSTIITDVSVRPTVVNEDDFKKAMVWIGVNFDMHRLSWFTPVSTKESIQKSSTFMPHSEKATVSQFEVESLIRILDSPEKVEGKREVQKFGTVEKPDLMTLVSVELIETGASCQRRMAAARRLGEIGGIEAGKALSVHQADKCRNDINSAIHQALNKVVKTMVDTYPDSQMLPTRLLNCSDKFNLLFDRNIFEFVALALGWEASEFVLSRLSKGNADEKIQCLAALGKIKRDESAATLLQYLSSHDNKIQTAALNALAECRSHMAANSLLKLYYQQSDRKQRRRYFRALLPSLTSGQETSEELKLIGESIVDLDLEIRKVATDYLLGNEMSAERLRQGLNDKQSVRERLRSLLKTTDTSEHYTAIRGVGILGQSDDIAALEQVKTFAKDSAQEVRNTVDKIRTRNS